MKGNVQQQLSPFIGYPTGEPRRSLFGQSARGGYQAQSYGAPSPYYQQPQAHGYLPQQSMNMTASLYQQPRGPSFFRDEQGKIDFKKIGGGVQTAMGIANQVGPVMKMLGGFLK